MVFERPLLLLIIPLALLLLWWSGRRSLTHWGPDQKTFAFAIRGLIVILLGCALAGPLRIGMTNEVGVIFLRDVSSSIDGTSSQKAAQFVADAGRGREIKSGEIVFAAEPGVLRSIGSAERRASDLPLVSRDATDLASALDFASALLPSDRAGRIVLLSDGGANQGRDISSSLAGLAARHVEVDVLSLDQDRRPDGAVIKLNIPSSLREGEVFDLPVDLMATASLPAARVRLYQNDLLAAETIRDLTPGKNRIIFPRIRAQGGMAAYEVSLSVPGDAHSQNDRLKAAVMHGGAARTLILDHTPPHSEPLAAVLRQAGFSVDIRPPAGLPDSVVALDQFDLIIMADASAGDFRNEQLQNLALWVKDLGGGFLMLGGENSFGAGGYFRTPVAALLPVKIERSEREETPVVALLVILDRSGSMAASAGDKTKMALADEGAGYALDILQSRDLFGLFAVDTKVHEVLPLGRISDKTAAARKIAGITAGGGGIYIYSSLAEALPRMRDADARLKHIILFADASDAEEKNSEVDSLVPFSAGRSSFDLAAALMASRITLSVVALGSEEDKDTAFLRELAARGGGRFYLTADAVSLPRLFAQETMRATQSSMREDAFLVRLMAPADVVAGIPWEEAPPLLGLNVSTPKPGAEVILATENEDPLFAIWRQGLGQAAAFLSDAGSRWASEWLTWPGFGKFWSQVARRLVRPDQRTDLAVLLREEGNKLVIEAEAVSSDGRFRNGLPVSVTIAGHSGQALSALAAQVAPGLYRAEVALPASDLAVLAVHDGQGRPVSLAWTRSPSREFYPKEGSRQVLEGIARSTGGLMEPRVDQVFRPAAVPAVTRRSLSSWFFGAALLLWPLDIWLRRREWKLKNPLPLFSRDR